MRAVNQSIGESRTRSARPSAELRSIGRAIRHAGDYATILLLDKRYAQSRIRNKLPKWIGEDVKVQEEYGGAAKAVAMFFKEKRERLGGTA
jgi:chromosome transmission fidelity protein 1